jgi:hypothetical protein
MACYRDGDSGAHAASPPMAMGTLSMGVRRQEPEADNSPSSSAEVKNGATLPPLRFMSLFHSA